MMRMDIFKKCSIPRIDIQYQRKQGKLRNIDILIGYLTMGHVLCARQSDKGRKKPPLSDSCDARHRSIESTTKVAVPPAAQPPWFTQFGRQGRRGRRRDA